MPPKAKPKTKPRAPAKPAARTTARPAARRTTNGRSSGSRVTPLGDRVVVKQSRQEEVRASGLVIPDTAREKPQLGEVIAVGPGRLGLVHANDSLDACGSTRDRHTTIGTRRSARDRSAWRRSPSCWPTRRWPASRWWWRHPASSTARRPRAMPATSRCSAR